MLRSFLLMFSMSALALLGCKQKPRADAVKPAPSRSAVTLASATAARSSVPKPADAIAEPGSGITSLTADETHLYWVSNGYEGSPKGIFSLPKAGGSPTKLGDVDQAMGVWATTGQLYSYDAGPELFTLPKGGGRAVSVVKSTALLTTATAAAGDTACWIGALREPAAGKPAPRAPGASAERKQVFASDRRTLYCRKDGASQSVAVAPVTIFSAPILVSGDQVFWATSTDALLEAAAVSGGNQRIIARGVQGVTALGANQSSLCFMGVHRGELGLYVVGKKGGTPKKLVPLQSPMRFVVADDHHAYYAIKGGLWRVPLKGGSPTALLGDDVQAVKGLVLDGSNVYLSAGPHVRQVKKPAP